MRKIVLGDVCDKIGSGATPRGGSDVYLSQGEIALIRSQNVYNDGFKNDGLAFITRHHAEELNNVTVEPDDILLNITGDSVARCCQVPNHKLPARVNQHVAIIRPQKDKLDARYLRYYLVDPTMQDYMLMLAGGGGTRNAITKGMIESFEIPAPPLPEQRAIAGVLGALDDKIELNRRMNRTLEAMARAVFREMMKAVEEQGSILEFANLLSGGTPRTAENSYWNGNIEWVSAKDVSTADGVYLLDTEKKITHEGINNSATKLLPAKTVIVTARGTVGAHCMLGKPMTMNQTNYGLKAKLGIGDYFVYFTLSEMIEQLKQQSYGTIFDTITTKTFQSALCAQPSLEVIKKFEDHVTPLMDAILSNQKESRTLANLRDTLLPKLMKGEVRVSEL
jgi:type I restriction enzyme S subunit